MNATQLTQEIKDYNALNTYAAYTVENDIHEIDIFYSQRLKKWVLFFNGKNIKTSKSLETLVNKLVDLNII
jgi:hypothetical protein